MVTSSETGKGLHDATAFLSCPAILRRVLLPLCTLIAITSCVSGGLDRKDFVSSYQKALVAEGPQKRMGHTGPALIVPEPDPGLPPLVGQKDITGKTTINLSIEDAVVRALAHSPEITVVSYDPSIAREDVSIAAAEFDITAFGELGYDKNDRAINDFFESGQTHSSLWEAGIKQKGITGAEWSLSYALARSVDESLNRRFETAYEPTLTFELKQPLLRNAWPDMNMADVKISRLRYSIALEAFREKAEEVSVRVITLYWMLLQARRDVAIQQDLLKKTIETLKKVQDRRDIDATLGDIKQTESSVKSREATLSRARQKLNDVQDELIRLLADHQLNLLDDLQIVPTADPDTGEPALDQTQLIALALEHNPEIAQATLKKEVAAINVKVAKRQKMPRLDVVASAQLQGLSDAQGEAQDLLFDRDYTSYSVGLTFEYPLGNREKKAEYRLRRLEHDKSTANLQNVTDRVAARVKERMRAARTAYEEMQVQRDAVEAARIYLQSLEDIEMVREKLTPEFLLTKIQAQDSLANARRAEIKAVADYNIALTRLAQATGKVLDLRYIKPDSKDLLTAD